MFHFHLTRFWFDQFKNRNKSFEYRIATPREITRLNNEYAFKKLDGSPIPCRIYCGYPKKDDPNRIIDGFVCRARFVRFCDLPQVEKRFFLNKDSLEHRITYNTFFIAYELEF